MIKASKRLSNMIGLVGRVILLFLFGFLLEDLLDEFGGTSFFGFGAFGEIFKFGIGAGVA